MTYPSERGRIVPPNLDDRTWQDLVDEVRALIPRYAPQWTDHNASDLGMTLVELFAWQVEGLIYRLNRVPEKHYLAFLSLLGITRNPPTPALTYLTFTSSAGATVVRAGAQAQTQQTDTEQPIVFETDADVTVLPVNLRHAVVVGPYTGNSGAEYTDETEVLVGPPARQQLLTLAKDEMVQLCFGFDQETTDEVALHLVLYRALQKDEAEVTVVCSAPGKDPHQWPEAAAFTDGTEGLQHDGWVRLTPAADWEAQRPTAEGDQPGWTKVKVAASRTPLATPSHWVGLRIHNKGDATIVASVDRVLFNSAPARTALTIRAPELLGVSNGEAFQQFALANRPLHPPSGPAAQLSLSVEVGQGTPPTWEEWALVDDLPEGDQHVCRADPVTGEILFGNFDEKTEQGHGSIPPAGAQVRARSYRYVAEGTSGNVAAGRVVSPGTDLAGAPLTGITVTNLGPGFDGSDEEPVEETLRRAPDVLKTRDRAVTVEDYENLARRATTDVVKARCLAPREHEHGALEGKPWTYAGLTRAPGSVYVIIVPDQGPTEPRPEPSSILIDEVQQYLDRRRDLTATLSVVGPRYLPIQVQAELHVWKQAHADEGKLKEDTERLINAYLHPTRGGPHGTGWEAGQPVFASDLFRAITPPENVAYIAKLEVQARIPAYHFAPINPGGTTANWPDPAAGKSRPFELGGPRASVRVADYEIVCAERIHVVTLKSTD